MKNHCRLLRIYNVLKMVVIVLGIVSVCILFTSPKYSRHTEPEIGIAIIGVPGDKGAKGDTGPKGATGDKGATGPGFWGKR